MKIVKGIALPDNEQHLVSFLDRAPLVDGKATYQLHKYQAALARFKGRGLAIDVGAHVGLWSRVMARDFAAVVAFEPVAEHAALWRENVKASNARLEQLALGAKHGTVVMGCPAGNSGNTRVSLKAVSGGQSAVMSTLDEELGDEFIDFLKVDCEGYEMFVLQGGRETILRCKPAIIVEQKPGNAQHFGLREIDAVHLLQGWGYVAREVIAGDYIMIHPRGN